ncbi:IS5 family transposase [Rudanella lutea]|uniref:IS5 family transposase n=1 Tax=Rudanella lutea TaxID=451374 RepID=UPI0012F93B61|nr:IS5 family transposase [Rudanella lutea]
MRRYEITEQEWTKITPLLPGQAGSAGRKALDNRLFINAVLWITRSGAPWRDLPERFGNWNSNYRRFRRWAQAGVWKQVFDALQEPDLDWVMIDSTTVRAHQQAAGQKKVVSSKQALGRSRGGLTTKIHALVDALGNPIRIELSPGHAGDAPCAATLLADCEAFAVIADKAYDADWLLEGLAHNGCDAIIPSKVNRVEQRVIDENLYADRNKIERYFNRLKQYRRVATRYEKTASSFLAMVHLASSMILLL